MGWIVLGREDGDCASLPEANDLVECSYQGGYPPQGPGYEGYPPPQQGYYPPPQQGYPPQQVGLEHLPSDQPYTNPYL